MRSLLPLAGLLWGCGLSAVSAARARAADEFHCSEEQVQAIVVSDPTIHVTACGHEATYTCPASYHGDSSLVFDRTCIREPDPAR
jgi:hypothetical protein